MGQQEYSPVYFVGVTVYRELFDSKFSSNNPLSPADYHRIFRYCLLNERKCCYAFDGKMLLQD